MKIVCSAGGIAEVKRPRNGFNKFRQAGFDEIVLDFNMFTGGIALPKKRDEVLEHWREWMKNYMAEAQRQGLKSRMAFAPNFVKEQKIPDMEAIKSDLVKECIEYAGEYGCKYIIVHPFEGDSLEDSISINRDFYLSLAECAQKADITILVVNGLRNLNGHFVRGFCSEPVQAVSFVDELNNKVGSEIFGFCLDAGLCNLVGQNMYDFVTTLGAHLKSLYLYENDGVHHNRMMPFFAANGAGSQFDWLNLIRGLRAIRFDGPAIMNFSTTLAAIPTLLRPSVWEFAHKVAKYLEWQVDMEAFLDKYSSRVLFGAGNMCRAYMKCYGEKYPPLYTCDNNSNVWGNEFCGLTIHNPEDLKALPADCAVFICNTYYDEIEQLLRDMGIKNPIERFNDEFMPSFHFTRLESDAWKGQVK
ncbi:Sugar phosphate isomerase/epimerase [Anaerovibrio lipolyticus DSM 3074]|uniref:Sugar phosphate isomerase/epimerase n=1 Tax=Anaerovibrio lipolyticus DSM 3074 TaxID=1120997 RepID=A0A1M6AMK9_9FIRM|nr:TIM barrel protein [Anaerovibrio lipolyticus]SHI37647.1 Sugar phosphate isomerase/epimerase [Anaerovibrio lipolyticus DSM 3074]